MTWSEFDISTALERDVLRRALPLVATESTGESRAVVDMGEPGARMFADVDATIFSTFHEVVGPIPRGCVDLLQIRPLLVGTAWKVLDLLIEAALAAAGEAPDQQDGRWSIKSKVRRAKACTARPMALSPLSWRALMATYVTTEDLRHSLVHRMAYTDPSGALVGHDRHGQPIRAVSPRSRRRSVGPFYGPVSSSSPLRQTSASRQT